MTDINWTTTTDLINNLKFPGVATPGLIAETEGYTTKGDGGGAQWKLNGVVGQTVSQSPFDLGTRQLNDASGNQWDLILSEDGSFNEVQVGGLVAALETLTTGGYLKVLNSTAIPQGINLTSTASIRIDISPDVTISAQAGFANAALLQFSGGGTSQKFEFYDGKLDGANVPFSAGGEANDLLNVTSYNEIYISRTHCDTNGGSDSCIFTANFDWCVITSTNLHNAPDAGIYTSGPASGSGRGACLLSHNRAENCGNEGFTAKRKLGRVIFDTNTAVNCSVGISTVDADTIAPAENAVAVGNIIERCTNGILFRLALSGSITGNDIFDMGKDAGVTPGAGIVLQGCKNVACAGNGIARANPASGLTAANFVGYVVQERLFNAVTTFSTYNTISGGVVADCGKVVREEGTANANNIYSSIGADTISGSNYTIGSSLSVVSTSDATGALWEWATAEGKIMSIQPTTTDNDSYLIIKMDQSGGAIVKRVKQGAADSGGVGFRNLIVVN